MPPPVLRRMEQDSRVHSSQVTESPVYDFRHVQAVSVGAAPISKAILQSFGRKLAIKQIQQGIRIYFDYSYHRWENNHSTFMESLCDISNHVATGSTEDTGVQTH